MKRRLMASLIAIAALVSSGVQAGTNPHIVDLDLSIDGVNDPEEFVEPDSTTPNGPGGFVALNGWKKIKLKANGGNPPMKTRLNWNSSKIEVWTAPSSGTQVPNPKQWDPASAMPSELWVKGIDVSGTGPTKSGTTWLTPGPEHLCLEAINNGAEPTTTPGTYYDRIAFTVVELEITSVPYSYYADSKSWVPFRFRAKGNSASPVTITGGNVEFYIGNALKFTTPLCAKPFKPTNGTATEYLAVINESLFDAVSTSGGVVANASFRLKDVCFTIGTVSYGPCDSECSTPFKFGDKTIEIIEFGMDEPPIDHLNAITRQNTRSKNESNSFRHKAGEPSCGTCPHDDADIYFLGFDAGYAGVMDGATTTAWTQRSRLKDGGGYTASGAGNTVEARSLDRQRGVYWVAYRNQVPIGAPGNPFGVPVVGTKAEFSGNATLFDGGTAQATITEDGLNNDSLTAAFTYTTAALGVFAAFVTGAAAPVMTAAVAIAGALAAISDAVAPIPDQNQDMATVSAIKVIGLAKIGASPVDSSPKEANAEPIINVNTVCATPSTSLGIGKDPMQMVVDNTYTMYLTHSTYVREISRYLETVEVEAKLDINLGTGILNVVWPTIPPEDANVIMCDF